MLGNYPSANLHKQPLIWNVLEGRELPTALGTCGSFVPLTSEEPFYLGTPAASEWGSPVKCKTEMSSAYKREIS